MKLVIERRTCQRVCDWESYALLRDNVQHFLENGTPSQRFSALHGIEQAVDFGERTIDAARLRGEVFRAWAALWQVTLDDSAVSLRTRSILTNRKAPRHRGTVVAARIGWGVPLPGPSTCPIPRVAASFIRAVLDLTESAVDGDVLQVRCMTPPPSEASQGTFESNAWPGDEVARTPSPDRGVS